MQTTDYQDLEPEPEKTASATTTAVANAVHLARLLRASPTLRADRGPARPARLVVDLRAASW